MVLLIAAGWFAAHHTRKLSAAIAFLGVYFLIATVTAFLSSPRSVAELFEIPDLNAALFFAFFMVTDPRTTVSTPRGRMIVVAIVALVETLIRLAGDYQLALLRPFYVSPPILALAMVGPLAMLWDLRRTALRA